MKLPILQGFPEASNIELKLNLHNGSGYVYDPECADYLNWIPYDLEMIANKQKYSITGAEFSLEGLKSFLNKTQALIDTYELAIKHNSTSLLTHDNDHFFYTSTEGEYEINFTIFEDSFLDEVMMVEIWLNASCIEKQTVYHYVGYRFMCKFIDLKRFLSGLCDQLDSLTALS